MKPIAHSIQRTQVFLLAAFALLIVGCQSGPEPEASETEPTQTEPAEDKTTEHAPTEDKPVEDEPVEDDPALQSGEPIGEGEMESLDEVVIDGQFIEVDGLEMRDVSCEFGGSADMFALVEVVATVADAKPTLDSCSPGGAAARISFSWPGNEAPKVLEITDEAARDCVAGAFAKLAGPMKAKCTAVVAFGESDGASAAAETLFPLEEETPE